MLSSKAKGDIAEDKAVIYLLKHGYRIVDRNYYTKFGELDIIAIKDGVMRFVEVKSGENFDPSINMTETKYKRMVKSIEVYLKKTSIKLPFCLDFISIHKDIITLTENFSI